MAKTTTRARVQVTLEFVVGDAWGEDCKVGQVYEQARESALGLLRRGLTVDGQTNPTPNNAERRSHVTVIGAPKIVAILVGEDDA